jgi:hypothetical protein
MTLDAVQDQLRLCVFLSELKAQRLAVRLRQQAHPGALAAELQRWVAPRLLHQLVGQARHRLRVVHAAAAPGQSSATKARRLPPALALAFARRLQGWLLSAWAEALKAQAPQIIAATEDPGDGITLRFVIDKPPGMKALADAAAGVQAAEPAATHQAVPSPAVRVEVAPGHRCG